MSVCITYVLHMLQRLILANLDHVKTMEFARSADLGLLASVKGISMEQYARVSIV